MAAYPIRLKGKGGPSSAHYFQAQKCEGRAQETKIRQASTPMMVAPLGQSRRVTLRSDWDRVKDSVMYDAVYAKFTQLADLRAPLLSTGEAKIMGHTDLGGWKRHE
ncbi:MAG: NADAR family protein [Bacteroidota bacterium]